MIGAHSGAPSLLLHHVSQLFYLDFSDFGSLSPTSPQIRYSLLECFFADFLFTFQLAYIPNLGPFGSRPDIFLLYARMQFSAIFRQLLPPDPRCVTLRCSFGSQIFYILCFILLARILATLEQSRLDFCPVPACSFLPSYTQCSPPLLCPSFSRIFSFTMDVHLPLDSIAAMATCAHLWPMPMPFKLLGYPCWSSSKTPCAPCSSASSSLPGFPFVAASCTLLPFSTFTCISSSRLLSTSSSCCSASWQLHCSRLFGLRGSVEI